MSNSRVLSWTFVMAALLLGTSARGDLLYTTTGSLRFDPLDVGQTFPYASQAGNVDHILWDDVPIAIGLTENPAVTVRRLTFNIERAVDAPAVDIDVYWANMVPDAGLNRGLSDDINTFDPPRDSPIDDPGTPHFVGRISLDANGPDFVFENHSIGDGINELFTTGVLDSTTLDYDRNTGLFVGGTHSGFGYFWIGLKFSTDVDNYWTAATHSDNLQFEVDDFQDADPSTIDEFDLGADLLDNPIVGTQAMDVEGTLIPEPASVGLISLLAAAFFARRVR